MDFGMLAPETNSERMHAGPGAGSIVEAAKVWERLAIRLYTAAADYRAVTARLSARWEGPAITEMAQAVIPYIDWLNATATRAECAAYQAAAAASAHESALAAVVPPSDIQANRGRRRSLAMANSLGHASPAIADIDADYERMWVQDADAMYDYARASGDASRLTPFISPPEAATEPAGQGIQCVDCCCRAGDRGGWPPSNVNDPGSSTRALPFAADVDSDAPIVGDIVSVKAEFVQRTNGFRDQTLESS
jgi:PPE-repeat protein